MSGSQLVVADRHVVSFDDETRKYVRFVDVCGVRVDFAHAPPLLIHDLDDADVERVREQALASLKKTAEDFCSVMSKAAPGAARIQDTKKRLDATLGAAGAIVERLLSKEEIASKFVSFVDSCRLNADTTVTIGEGLQLSIEGRAMSKYPVACLAKGSRERDRCDDAIRAAVKHRNAIAKKHVDDLIASIDGEKQPLSFDSNIVTSRFITNEDRRRLQAAVCESQRRDEERREQARKLAEEEKKAKETKEREEREAKEREAKEEANRRRAIREAREAKKAEMKALIDSDVGEYFRTRICVSLRAYDVRTLRDLIAKTEEEIRKFNGLGDVFVSEIVARLGSIGLGLRDNKKYKKNRYERLEGEPA